MTQYRTLNPLGSMAPKDLFDNAQNVDNWANGEEPFYEDRFGILRRSFSGMNFEFDAAQTGRTAAFNAQMATLGYVSKGAYAAGVVLDAYSEYVAVPGTVSGGTAAFYRPGPDATLPLTLEGDWTIDGPKLVMMSSEDLLRQDLAENAGAGMIGHEQSRIASAVAGTVQSALDTFISVHTSGAVGDGATDDTAAINALIRDVAVLGGGEIRFSPGRTYFIPGTILLPSNIKLNLCGATLKGSGTTVGAMFRSGWLVDGVVVSNIGAAPETQLVRHASVSGGIIADVGLGFDLYNFVMGCSLKQLIFQNCRQAWKMERCFYPTIEDIFTTGGSDINFPCYHFKDQANAMVLTRVSCTMEYGYLIEGCTAFTMKGCTFEGGSKGVKLTGDCLGVSIEGGYFEAVPGTLFDLSEAGTCAIKFSGNYINYVDVVFNDGGSTTGGPFIFGDWDNSNYIANINGVTGGFTYRGRMQVSSARNFMSFALAGNGEASQVIPANWIISKNTDISVISSAAATSVSDFRQKSIYSGNAIIPMRRGGDVGPAYAGSVFYSAVTSASGSVTIDTKINYRPDSLFAKFTFTVQDGNGTHQVFGDIYGANVDKRGSTPVTVTAVDNGGMLRLVLGITGTLLVITGSVQICS